MNKIDKLADLFEKKVNEDVFEEISWAQESEKLYHLAGKILYKSNKTNELEVGKKLKEVGKLLLDASDILKNI